MKTHYRSARFGLVILAVGLSSLGAFNVHAAQKAAPAATNTASVLPPIPSAEIPQSVFVIPANAREGRNPFFPQSSVVAPPPKISSTGALVDLTAGFVLNGITSPPRRTAMINGVTFEPGEEHEIKMPDGSKRLIKCEEIKSDSAIISAGGVRRELKLRFGL